MNKYELALILDPTLTDEAKAERFGKVSELLERFGCKIEKVDDWGKRRLAYEIEKKNEGFYYFIYFDANSDSPIEIENRLRIMDDVLRYLIVRSDV
jgi:small subunit ribosomal protein S6